MMTEKADEAACRGRLCSSVLGLDLRHFTPLWIAECFVLIALTFCAHWAIAYHLMHPDSGLVRRCMWAFALTASYAWFVFVLVPWNPYWIRELHVMAMLMTSWKLAELAILREGEDLLPFLDFLAHDAMCLRPQLLSTSKAAKKLEALSSPQWILAAPQPQDPDQEIAGDDSDRNAEAASRQQGSRAIRQRGRSNRREASSASTRLADAGGGVTQLEPCLLPPLSSLRDRLAAAAPVLALAAGQYMSVEVRRWFPLR